MLINDRTSVCHECSKKKRRKAKQTLQWGLFGGWCGPFSPLLLQWVINLLNWQAPESVNDMTYSPKSDVWTFGVVGTSEKIVNLIS